MRRRPPYCLYRDTLSVVLLGLVTLAGCQSSGIPRSLGDSEILPAPSELKKRLAVLEFTTKVETQGWREASAVAADMLTTSLFGTQQFILVERQEIEKVLNEQELLKSGEVDPRQAARAGQLLGTQALVLGTITQMGLRREGISIANRTVADVAVDIRLVDTTTGEISQAVTGTGQDMVVGASFPIPIIGPTTLSQSPERDALLQNALRKALNNVAPKLVTQMQRVPWTAYIASVERDGIYLINAGATQGLTPQKRLAVFRQGEIIHDPLTKKSLGFRKERVGEVEVSSVEPAYAVAVGKEGGPFRVKDVVQATEKSL